MKRIAALQLVLLLVSLSAHSREELPVEAFASLPDVQSVKISPNAQKLALLESVNTGNVVGTALRIIDLETRENNYPFIVKDRSSVLNWIRWANDNTLLASVRFPGTYFGLDTSETRIVKIDVGTGEQDDLLGVAFWKPNDRYPFYQDQIIDILPDEPNKLLLGLQVSPPELSAFKVDLNRKNKRDFISTNKESAYTWITDRNHDIRIGCWYQSAIYQIKHRPRGENDWETLWEFKAFSEEAVWPLGFDEDPDTLYVRAYHEGKYAIFKVDLASEDLSRELVLANSDYDIEGNLVYSHLTNKAIGIAHNYEGGFTFWDPEYIALQKSLDEAFPGSQVLIVDLSQDERSYVFLVTSSTNAGSYYLAHRDTGHASLIGHRYSDLDANTMAETKPVSYTARDGLNIQAFLTVPIDFSANDSDPVPAIVLARAHMEGRADRFDYWTQFFANRGYAVLRMHIRGTQGYGYDFMQAGLKSQGLESQYDVADGTHFLVQSGIADPNKVCVVGKGLGGHAALMEAAKNSEHYRCAVSFSGATDIQRLLGSTEWWSHHEITRERYGSDRESLRDRSPVNLADQIDIPVLLIHGSADRVIDVSHGREMSTALKKFNKDFIYIEQKDGNHFLDGELHRIEVFTEMDRFLKQHLQ